MSLHKINYIFIQELKRFLKTISIPFSMFLFSSVFIQFSFLSRFNLSRLNPSVCVCVCVCVCVSRTERDRQGGKQWCPGRSSHQLKGLGAGERHLRGHAELALSPSSLSVCLGKCYYFYYRVQRGTEIIRAYSGAEWEHWCQSPLNQPMIWAL